MELFLAVLLFLSSALTVSACSTDHDCSLNGVCTGSSCVCDPGWIGSDCGALDLRAAKPNTGYDLTKTSNTSSWCAHVRQDPSHNTTFYLIASEFVHNCGIDYWKPYSRIIRAVSTTGPQGPYAFAAEIAGTFAHNPTVVWSPADKLYLLYHIGCNATVNAGCNGKSTSCAKGTGGGESSILVHSSPDLLSWTYRGAFIGGTSNTAWDSDTTNPSAWPLYTAANPTSEMVLAYRGSNWDRDGGAGSEHNAITSAPRYNASYPHSTAMFPNSDADEDPFIWRDKRGNWHMLMHALISQYVGRHAYTANWNGTWTYGATQAYSTTVKFTDGTTINFTRRERPQLYFSTDGNMTPLYLSSGVTKGNSGQSYSIVVPIGSGAAAYEASLGFHS